MNLRFRHLFIAFSITFIACEPDRIEPIVDCSTINLEVSVISSVNASCSGNDGSITLEGSGGKPPYQFSSNGGAFNSDSVFTELATGSYTITIKDSNECTGTVQAIVGNNAGFTIQASAEPSNCAANDGSITVTPTGGTGLIQYKLGVGSFSESNVFTNVAEGTYTVTAKDANGCETTIQVVVDVIGGLTLSFNTQDAGCGTSNGRITVNVEGGVAPYQYKLGSGSFVSSNVFSNLSSGSKSVTAKDSNGCEETKSHTVLSGVKFSSTISAIISSNCATSSCHGGSQMPNLSSFTNIKANAQAIKNATGNKSMPKNGSLSQSQIDAIACWVNDGAPNN